MSWESETWKQDNNQNLGYPIIKNNYPVNTNLNPNLAPTLWHIRRNVFLNYPYIKNILDIEEKTFDEIDLLLIDEGINDLINRMINGQNGDEEKFSSPYMIDSYSRNYSNRVNELWNQLIHHMRNKFDCRGDEGNG